MLQQRKPRLVVSIISELARNGGDCFPLQQLFECASQLQLLGVEVPSWELLSEGARPPPLSVLDTTPGCLQMKGWQRWAAYLTDVQYRTTIWHQFSETERAHVRSQSGKGSGIAFTVIPTSPELSISSQLFRILLLRRFRIDLPLCQRVCRCRRFLDLKGDHRAACAVCGVLSKRGFALESAMARVCRESGARVQFNSFLRDLNIGPAGVTDGRRIEVIANGLPLFKGAQLAIDTTIVCPVGRDGTAHARAADVDGISLEQARARKERRYPELIGIGGRAKLVVFALETGGRWSDEAWRFIHLLSKARARSDPKMLQKQAAIGWAKRWQGLLAVSAQKAFAGSLLEQKATHGMDGECPSIHEMLYDCTLTPAVAG